MKVKCIKCNLEKGVVKPTFEKRMKKLNVNNLEEMNKVYVCRTCRKE